jgi:dihydroorotate dehydrogenase (fumarate)
MAELSTNYLGLALKNPFIASSSPLTQRVETALQLEEAGVAAIVMPSLFEEQIIQESLKLQRDLERGAEEFAEAMSYLPDYGQYSIGPDTYVENVKKTKDALGIPVLGSLNGVTSGGWIDYARKIEDAGADAIELNIYDLAVDPEITSSQLEETHIELVGAVRQEVNIPIAVKLSPFYTALPNFARRLTEAGADGLVLFNRFYQPDYDFCAYGWRARCRRPAQGHDGRRQGGHGGVRTAQERHITGAQDPDRCGSLDGAVRICLHRTNAGQHEPDRGR